ncbi:MAG: hypothetical protein MRJ65_03640 [Candidatus Brocadiaceae bacterium]|nr:hypothetical protein [Candidatus Brocadiaceae bacterium]
MKNYILKASLCGVLPLTLIGCGGDRVFWEFKTPKESFINGSVTDPDVLNKELEHDIRQAEKKMLQKQQAAEEKPSKTQETQQ